MSPKPPDILRKSHRHTERKERATTKEELRKELPDAVDELDDEEAEQATEGESRDRRDEGS